ncbi:UDP-N-acetylglucosamine:LPS N-acetylglucosamine transferase [Candidatus Burkholderia verschuerenii]|uniref:UDP-N-acetylglucosamine:LPS N-acetylglucosamine transferase n=1 Tax=Candidatus Burkholderia verschuerenii TaxID=242163 RepID=A0A0L0M4C5_9BURK|nr:glycosyltransferase [Candidatus Burkholderia verschuerenii]KND57110.1 UDP-N-acetylglucosamine:LPS N-acetylglucosamine transferase [Candidatus Burkholderia verschuerenii]
MFKIVILSVSAGAGHVRAADALCAYAAQHPGGVEAVHLDVLDFVPASFRALYSDLYLKLVSHQPALWSYLYRKSEHASPRSLAERIRRAVERLNCRALKAEIARHNADAIICTHFLPAELLSREHRVGQLSTPVWVQVTDFDLHRMWVVPGMQGYFAANDEVAWRMAGRGIAPDSIHVSGIPIMPAFGRPLDRETCAKEYGLDPKRTTLLMMSGGAGIGALDVMAERLLKMDGDFQLIALAGRNEAMLRALRALGHAHPGRLVASGFTSSVERLMACADLIITKPGGLTTSECLAMQVPMILNSPIPGQEERNADFLLEQGVALKAVDSVALEYRVRMLTGDAAQLGAMRQRIAPLARPDAARTVLDTVIDSLRRSRAREAA